MAHVSRRSVLAAAGGAVAAASVGCSRFATPAGQRPPLRVTLVDRPWARHLALHVGAFEQASGLRVTLSIVDVATSTGGLNSPGASDVVMFRPMLEGVRLARAGRLVDLADLFRGESTWHIGDFADGPRWGSADGGRQVGVPVESERHVLMYRRDLLSAAGIALPSTIDELDAAARALAAPGVAGLVLRTDPLAAVQPFTSLLVSSGGSYLDRDGQAALDSAQARGAFATYARLVRDHGPAGAGALDGRAAVEVFRQGNAAFCLDVDSFHPLLFGDDAGAVRWRVGLGLFPAAEDGSWGFDVATWSLGVDADADRAEDGWRFVQWATTQDGIRSAQKAGVAGARTSVWRDPVASAGFPTDMADIAVAVSRRATIHDRPPVVESARGAEIVARALGVALSGGDLDAATSQATRDLQALLDAEAR